MQPTLDTAVPIDLGAFFDRLHKCRDKNAHVHGIHPYPAKFIPHIPRMLIRAYAPASGVVLDPMCGSGTTLVEAAVEGFDSVGVDSNPIATLVSRAKMNKLPLETRSEVRSLIRELDEHATKVERDRGRLDAIVPVSALPTFHNRDKWFERAVSQELQLALKLINEVDDQPARDLALCTFSAAVVAVSNQESETRWCARPTHAPVGAVLRRVANKLADSLRRCLEMDGLRRGDALVHLGDARSLPLEDASVDMVVTSPPYANSHDYYLYNKLRLFWLGYDVVNVQQTEIGSRNRHSDQGESIETYIAAMGNVLSEVARVLRRGGHAAIVVADSIVRGEFFDMGTIYDEIAASAGLQVADRFEFAHKRFNSTFQSGFGTSRNKQTHVLIYRANS